jgi:hypothetical protein
MRETPDFKAWLKEKIDNAPWVGMGTPNQKIMLEFWEDHRPKMFNELKAMGAVKMLAQYLENQAIKAMTYMIWQGFLPSVAMKRSQEAWFLLEVETEAEKKLDLSIFAEHLMGADSPNSSVGRRLPGYYYDPSPSSRRTYAPGESPAEKDRARFEKQTREYFEKKYGGNLLPGDQSEEA